MDEDTKVEEGILVATRPKSNWDKLLKWMAVIIGISVLALLVLLKINRPSFPTLWFIILLVGAIIVFSLAYFIPNFIVNLKKGQEEEKEKKGYKQLISMEQARNMALSILKHPFYLEYPTDVTEETFVVGRERRARVYKFQTVGLYKRENICILINLYDPDSIDVLVNKPQSYIWKKINSIVEPFEEPDREEISEYSPLTGIERGVRRIIRKEQAKQKEEPKTGGLK